MNEFKAHYFLIVFRNISAVLSVEILRRVTERQIRGILEKIRDNLINLSSETVGNKGKRKKERDRGTEGE